MDSVLNLSGIINQQGGLLLPMEQVNDFCRKYPGSRVLLRIEAIGAATSAAQRRYYFGYVVPEIRAALAEQGTILSDEETDEFLRGECALCYREGELMTVGQMPGKTFGYFLEWLKQYAAENLYVFIDDPKDI